jgi:TolB-like protein
VVGNMLVSIEKPPDDARRAPDTKLAKRRAKVRSAWISFAGRIVAQILGAAATVGFALIVLHGEPASKRVESAAVPSPSAGVARPLTSRPTVAVLPFHAYAATSEHDHIAAAITDLLVTDLARTGNISVTSLTSTLRYQKQPARVPEIGRELGATHIVEGSITVANGHARVIAQLIDAATDQHVWAASYETPVDNVLALERRVADQIATELAKALTRAR